MREITYVEAVREAQAEALASDDRVFIMGQEIGEYGGCSAPRRDWRRDSGPTGSGTCRSPSSPCWARGWARR